MSKTGKRRQLLRLGLCILTAALAWNCKQEPNKDVGRKVARTEVPQAVRRWAARFAKAPVLDLEKAAERELTARLRGREPSLYRVRARAGDRVRVEMKQVGTEKRAEMTIKYYRADGIAPAGHASTITCAEPGCSLGMTVGGKTAKEFLVTVEGTPNLSYRLRASRSK